MVQNNVCGCSRTYLGVRSCLTGCLGCLLPLVDVQVVIFLMRQRRGIEILPSQQTQVNTQT